MHGMIISSVWSMFLFSYLWFIVINVLVLRFICLFIRWNWLCDACSIHNNCQNFNSSSLCIHLKKQTEQYGIQHSLIAPKWERKKHIENHKMYRYISWMCVFGFFLCFSFLYNVHVSASTYLFSRIVRMACKI